MRVLIRAFLRYMEMLNAWSHSNPRGGGNVFSKLVANRCKQQQEEDQTACRATVALHANFKSIYMYIYTYIFLNKRGKLVSMAEKYPSPNLNLLTQEPTLRPPTFQWTFQQQSDKFQAARDWSWVQHAPTAPFHSNPGTTFTNYWGHGYQLNQRRFPG